MKLLVLACAMLVDRDGRLLVVRKQGTSVFMMPGGKIESGEEPAEALVRELNEELGLQIAASDIEYLGTHETTAANEKNTFVMGHVYKVWLPEAAEVSAHAEIVEIAYLTTENYEKYTLAHLLSEFTLPRWLELYDS